MTEVELMEIIKEIIKYLEEKAEKINRYSNKLREYLTLLDDKYFLTLKLGIKIIDDIPVYYNNQEAQDYYLFFDNSGFWIVPEWVQETPGFEPSNETSYMFNTAPRKALINVISRLPKFLLKIKNKVMEIETTIAEKAETVEKWIQAIEKVSET